MPGLVITAVTGLRQHWVLAVEASRSRPAAAPDGRPNNKEGTGCDQASGSAGPPVPGDLIARGIWSEDCAA